MPSKSTRRDLTGQQFNRWTVIRYHANVPQTMWFCRCSCGTERAVRASALLRNGSKSCGCLKDEVAKTTFLKHGMYKTSEYRIWQAMCARCTRPTYPMFKYYGGRGISVCEAWLKSFENFYRDVGPRPPGYQLERKDNNGPYSPENVVWADRYTQNRNKRSNRFLTFQGRTMILTDWAKEIGIPY